MLERCGADIFFSVGVGAERSRNFFCVGAERSRHFFFVLELSGAEQIFFLVLERSGAADIFLVLERS